MLRQDEASDCLGSCPLTVSGASHVFTNHGTQKDVTRRFSQHLVPAQRGPKTQSGRTFVQPLGRVPHGVSRKELQVNNWLQRSRRCYFFAAFFFFFALAMTSILEVGVLHFR